MSESIRERVIDIGHGIPWLQQPGWFNQCCFTLLERVLAYHTINDLFSRAAAGDPAKHYLTRLIEVFRFERKVSGLDEANWPSSGAVIVVANHPFGGADATVIGELAFEQRPDTRILTNEFLGTVEPLSESLITVDVYGGDEATRKNRRGLRETAEHLRNGGQLVIFPSGEVASWSWKERGIVEPPWADHAVTLARKFDATIVPVFVEGRNSLFFQILGMIHPFLRTTWLGREYLKKRKKEIKLIVRKPIKTESLADEDPTAQLRKICFGES